MDSSDSQYMPGLSREGEEGVETFRFTHSGPGVPDRDTNEWWLLRCLEEAVRDIDRLTNELSTDFNAISEAFMRKNRALSRLDEVRNG